MADVGNQQLVRLAPDSVADAGLIQTLLSAMLLLLFLLAMRNQFRIRKGRARGDFGERLRTLGVPAAKGRRANSPPRRSALGA